MKKLILGLGLGAILGSLLTLFLLLEAASKSEPITAGLKEEIQMRVSIFLFGEPPKRPSTLRDRVNN